MRACVRAWVCMCACVCVLCIGSNLPLSLSLSLSLLSLHVCVRAFERACACVCGGGWEEEVLGGGWGGVIILTCVSVLEEGGESGQRFLRSHYDIALGSQISLENNAR